MFHATVHAAHKLDLWLRARLGRPYAALLGFGLTIEVIRRLVELPEHLGQVSRLGGAVLLILMNLALLLHQVGELSHHFRRRGPGEAAESSQVVDGAGRPPAGRRGRRRET
jgi:hypothetical protein